MAAKQVMAWVSQVLCRLEEAYEARQARVGAEVRPRVGLFHAACGAACGTESVIVCVTCSA